MQTSGQMTSVQGEMSRVMGQVEIAMRNPRDPDKAMDMILRECKVRSVAEGAEYSYQRGGTPIRDASIRLAEVLARNWGNIISGTRELSRFRDPSTGKMYAEMEAFAFDLERNTGDTKTFQTELVRDTKQGSYALTADRDIYEHTANMAARRKRACILTVIPSWVKEAALDACRQTVEEHTQVNQDTIKYVTEGFARFDVTKADLEKRLGHPLTVKLTTRREIADLRSVFQALADGVQRVADFFPREAPESTNAQEAPSPPSPADEPGESLRSSENGPPDEGGEQAPMFEMRPPTTQEVWQMLKEARTREQLDDVEDLARDVFDPNGQEIKQFAAAAGHKREQLK